MVGLLEFSGGKTLNRFNLLSEIVFGNMAGLLFSSFLAHFFGFIGPFAAFGLIFVVYGLSLNRLIAFMPQNDELATANGSALLDNGSKLN